MGPEASASFDGAREEKERVAVYGVIYYLPDGESFWMLTIYGKGDVDSIPGPMLKKIKEVMEDG